MSCVVHGTVTAPSRARDRSGLARVIVPSRKLRGVCSSVAIRVGAVAFVAGIGLAAASRLTLVPVKDFEIGDGTAAAGPGYQPAPPDRAEGRR